VLEEDYFFDEGIGFALAHDPDGWFAFSALPEDGFAGSTAGPRTGAGYFGLYGAGILLGTTEGTAMLFFSW